jgi:integrase
LRGRFIETRARKAIADIFAIANAAALPSSTVHDFLVSWLKRKQLEADENTAARYASIVSQFRKHIGPKAGWDIASISAADITGFRDALAERLAPGSVNLSVKVLRIAFGQARRDGLVDVNQAERVTLLKRRDEAIRRPFTLDELRRLLAAADEEWQGMILFGIYTGQRLGDIATLDWRNVDLQNGELRLVTGKTGRRQIMPLAAPLVRWLESASTGNEPEAPLFPGANAIMVRQGRAGGLSNQFACILAAAGLAPKKSHHAKVGSRKGRGASRQQSELSFHSLRHTTTTLLKSAGVSDAVAREFVGHDSAAVSANYTHIPVTTLKSAVDKMPDVFSIKVEPEPQPPNPCELAPAAESRS